MDHVKFEDDNPSAFHPGYEHIIHKSWKPRIHIHKVLHLQGLSKTATLKKSRGLTSANVDHWTESFDSLLSDLNGQIAFKTFLKSEFCEENIEFWLACEEFKEEKKTKETLASAAVDIYEQFIKTNSPKQINLDSHTKKCIAQSLHHPTTSCYAEAQRKIYHLMKNDVYPRFIQSDFYNDLRTVASTGVKKNRRRILLNQKQCITEVSSATKKNKGDTLTSAISQPTISKTSDIPASLCCMSCFCLS